MKYLLTVTRNSYAIVNLISSLTDMAKGLKTRDIFEHWIIVDNHSSDEFLDTFRSFIETSDYFQNKVTIIRLNHNYLFTKATNIGISYIMNYLSKTTRGFNNNDYIYNNEYIYFVNPDIYFNYESGPNLFDEINGENGIFAPVLYFPYSDRIESIGGKDNEHIFYNKYLHEFYNSEEYKVYKGTLTGIKYWCTEWTTGAFLSIPIHVLSSNGLLDENLTHWVSDQEYCRRFSYIGNYDNDSCCLISETTTKVYHNQGTSTEVKSHKAVFEDLPANLLPNDVPINLNEIIIIAKKNADKILHEEPEFTLKNAMSRYHIAFHAGEILAIENL